MTPVEKAESLEVGDRVTLHTEMDETITGEVDNIDSEDDSYRDIFLTTEAGQRAGIAIQYQSSSVYASRKDPRTGNWDGLGEIIDLEEQ